MKQLFFILFLLLSKSCFAQLPVEGPTLFDKFITDPKIEWAMYNMDSIHFQPTNLSELLRTRFDKGEIRVSYPLEINTQLNQRIAVASHEEIKRLLYPSNGLPAFDSLGNAPGFEKAMSTQTNFFDSITNNVLDVLQIFYIENGVLRSYVPFVSPAMSVYTSTGLFLGHSDYFSTCFNYAYNYKPKAHNSVSFVLQTKKMILQDSLYRSSKLKELYGRNLVRTLWPYLLNKKLNIADVETDKKLAIEDIIKDIALNDPARNPSYDSMLLMNIINPYTEKLTQSYITSLEVVQDWFYDQTKNIVFNKVRELHVIMRPWKTGDEGKAPAAVFKILF